LLSEIDATELDDWYLLESVDPWGQLRDDIRIADLSAHIANLLARRKDGDKGFNWTDYLLRFEIDQQEVTPQTTEQIEKILLRWAKITNARFAQKGLYPES